MDATSHALNPTVMKLAHDLYAVYNASSGGKNYQGLPCPTWQTLTPAIRGHWYTVALRSIEAQPNMERPGSNAAGSYSLGHLPDPEAAHATWCAYVVGESAIDS